MLRGFKITAASGFKQENRRDKGGTNDVRLNKALIFKALSVHPQAGSHSSNLSIYRMMEMHVSERLFLLLRSIRKCRKIEDGSVVITTKSIVAVTNLKN